MTPRRDSKGGGSSRSQGGRSGDPQSSSQNASSPGKGRQGKATGASGRDGASGSQASSKGFSSLGESPAPANSGRGATVSSSPSGVDSGAAGGAQSRFGAPTLKSARSATAGRKARAASSNAKAIPDAVAQRMARRIALATGIPTLMGMGVFVGSYVLITQGIADIPPSATLVASGGCFLLGLLGLSYGVLSASWEEQPGSLLGSEQIGLNINRLRASIRAMRQGGS